MPLSDTVGAAVTVAHYERGGEYENHYPGNALNTIDYTDRTGGESSSSITGVLSIAASDRVDIQAHAMYEQTNDDQYAIALMPSSMNNCYRVTRGGSLTQPMPPAGTPEALRQHGELRRLQRQWLLLRPAQRRRCDCPGPMAAPASKPASSPIRAPSATACASACASRRKSATTSP